MIKTLVINKVIYLQFNNNVKTIKMKSFIDLYSIHISSVTY